ncbi:TonB-dependent receptor plug [Haliangium ochraceum DSM 14365]|uniref:TonB-dependent receptor plug n=1 Tax=Haliangium ochraceum (strain DSM 14365 / JCM 11303 / SMP-2) TaxID=502025 RepID=D0LGP8_HALO1|nr:TonB-dependent receptor plug [Haliangium ochraceum DSM 14365]
MRRYPVNKRYVSAAALVAAALMASPAIAQTTLEQSVPEPPPAPVTQGSITGTVVSETTGIPLSGAQVTIPDTQFGVFADENGQFTITGVPAGTYTVSVSLGGYLETTAQVSVSAGGTADAMFTMPDDPSSGEVIVIVGSRTQRTITESPVPIDVISADAIEESGHSEANQILASVAPSYNATHQTIADGSDHVNPAALRGLGPGQVLVLINGKRRHASALMHVNGTYGRGTVGVDLNAIPTSAIERIEILRDGASAQYGSDAIAGVINIVLKDYKELLTAQARSGITAYGDGFEIKLGANYGIRLGEDGVLNISGEFLQRNPTDRSGPWEGSFYPGVDGYDETTDALAEQGLSREDVSMDIGQSRATVGSLMLNAELPMGEGEVYAFGGATYRDGKAAGFYRRPEQSDRSVPEVYPNGFLPEIHTDILDWSAAAGYRHDFGTWNLDASVNHGGNFFLYTIENSINASIGPTSPTDVYAGGPLFNQTTVNVDAVTELPVAGIEKLGLAAGAEYRLDNYRLFAGKAASWKCGRFAPEKACGIQVFPGFQPDNEVDVYRYSGGGYLGLESQLHEQFFVDVAGRFEAFEDFGPTVNGKVAARWNMKDNMAMRGAVSTGYRAPALHQIYYNTIGTQFVANPVTGDLEPKQVLTAKNTSNIARAFGIPELEEETSINVSAGIAARPRDDVSITIDAYRIAIDDRIVLTSRFADTDASIGDQVRMLLPDEVSQVQFFTNAVDTVTRGIDVVADHTRVVGEGTLGLTLSGSFTLTKVEDVNVPQGVADRFGDGNIESVRTIIFNREEQNRLENVVPHAKATAAARYRLGPLTTSLRANYYGGVSFRSTNASLDEYFGPKVIFDLDVGYNLGNGIKVSAGAQNLLNTMPDEHALDANRFNEQFIYSRGISQFGMNGGFYYLQLQYLM